MQSFFKVQRHSGQTREITHRLDRSSLSRVGLLSLQIFRVCLKFQLKVQFFLYKNLKARENFFTFINLMLSLPLENKFLTFFFPS